MDSVAYVSTEPRFAFCASAASLSRSGPMVALEPAGVKVWQLAQPALVKTALPAVALPAGGLGGVGVDAVVAGSLLAASLSLDSAARKITADNVPAVKTSTATMNQRIPLPAGKSGR